MLEAQAAIKYLADRGINEEDIQQLGIQISGVHPQYTEKIVTSIIFHHYDRQGVSLDWYSARLLYPEVELTGLMAQTTPTKPRKTHCPTGEQLHGYYPQNYDWSKLKRGERVFLCESPLKAAVVSKLGHAAIGLNGVAGYSQRKRNVVLLPEIMDMDWRAMDLYPIILFDSDAQDNEGIAVSIQRLGGRLRTYCSVQAFHIAIPHAADGSKQGIDDYIAGGGDPSILDGDGEPVDGGAVQAGIADLNEEVVMVDDLRRIVEIEHPIANMMTGPVFSKQQYANRIALVEVTVNGAPVNRPVSIADAWLKSDARRSVRKVDYIPEGEAVVDGDYVNLWRGWGVDREEGDPSFFEGFVDYLIPDEAQAQYFLDWLAWPIQNPGGRMAVCSVIVGGQGVGKSRLMDLMCNIYGNNNSVQIGGKDLEEKHAMQWPTSQFVNIDEMGKSKNPQATMDLLKRSITSRELTINPKHSHPFKVTPRFNMCFTTNHWDSLRMDAEDRRFFVAHAAPLVDHTKDAEFWRVVSKHIDERAGVFRNYLLERDLGEFDPYGWAPETVAKAEMKEASRGAVEQFANDLVNNWADFKARGHGRCVYTVKQLTMFWDGEPPKDDGWAITLGRHLRDLGVKSLGQVKIGGVNERYIDMSNRETEWTKEEVRNHVKMYSLRDDKSKY